MKTGKTKAAGPGQCSLIFIVLILPLAAMIFTAYYFSSVLLGLLLWFAGWFTWTFTEYMLHRFRYHETGKRKGKLSTLHQFHHSHPREIRITGWQRTGLGLVSILSLLAAIRLGAWLFYFSGFICGSAMYFFMHYIIHQQWSLRLFPVLHRNHIYHHCISKKQGHGISISWWDRIFHTFPAEPEKISERIKRVYYKGSTR